MAKYEIQLKTGDVIITLDSDSAERILEAAFLTKVTLESAGYKVDVLFMPE